MSELDIAAMRDWCEDCYEDMPADATDEEVVQCVKNQYAGGLVGFLADAA